MQGKRNAIYLEYPQEISTSSLGVIFSKTNMSPPMALFRRLVTPDQRLRPVIEHVID
jgi:hypothetical protein